VVRNARVSRIFLSHSSSNNAEAVTLRDWLTANGWKDDIFLDLDPKRGIAAGERWDRALHEAASRCEAVLFLVSKAWLASRWCLKELNLAQRMNKRLFGVLIEDLSAGDLPEDLVGTWQIVRLASGTDHIPFRAVLPITQQEVHVTFSAEGLQRLKHGLEEAGLGAKYFAWPPQDDPDRPPYRGLRALEAEDAGIFFGRAGPIVEALDRLRGLREATPPRLLVILGASGAGKSSFLRAGLLPRLARDDRNFLPLPIIRPERAAISGETGLVAALDGAFAGAKLKVSRADLRTAIGSGAAALRPLLQALADKATPIAADGETKPKPPTLIVSIDQGEELFLAEAQDEALRFLALLRDLLNEDAPGIIAVFTIRSDNYERLQLAKELEGVHPDLLSLPPMPQGSYAEVVKGPALRLEGTPRAIDIEDSLVDALLADIEAGGAKDALPLLAFTLERLYGEYHGGGHLKLAHYRELGGVKGSIEAAVERALKAADADPAIPKDRVARLALLRRGLIPWLADIDPDTGAPRRRVARLSEIPADARPLIQHLVEQRLLATDVAKDTGTSTIEPAHEALLRQWSLLGGWLTEDTALLAVLEGIKRASRDWAASNRNSAWLAHATDRLAAANRLSARPDLAANLEPADIAYLNACRNAEAAAKSRKRRVQAVIYALLVGIIGGLIGWINQDSIKDEWRWFAISRPFMQAKIRTLTAAAEHELKPHDAFRECTTEAGKDYCPELIVTSAGSFVMGSPATENGHEPAEEPQHAVRIAKPFAVAKFALTFDEWDTCVTFGDCRSGVSDSGWGRGRQPVINVTFDDAQRYVAWLSRMTGKRYRLLTEAEYEYATRAGRQTVYPWGDDPGSNNADCNGCGSRWDYVEPAPVGSFAANAFGLYDMVGSIWEWVADCYHPSYEVETSQGKVDAPADGSEWTSACPADQRHVVRGGAWHNGPENLRAAYRTNYTADDRSNGLGLRVARTLDQ
jgi:formylglycine-generating enzyme required for sulfatase activity